VLSKMRRFVQDNGWHLLLVAITRRMAATARGILYSQGLTATGMSIGESPYICGAKSISIGSRFKAGKNLWLHAVHQYEDNRYAPKIIIGNNVGVSDSVHIAATNSVVLGDGVLVGSRVLITDHSHGIYSGKEQSAPEQLPSKRKLSAHQSVFIECNVWIGDGVVVLPGSHIGEGSIIGANSVVKGDIPPRCIAIGSPARPIRSYDRMSKEWVKWIPK
jgi:acetyltransferase-like isoleucine patch superfamily enzyme